MSGSGYGFVPFPDEPMVRRVDRPSATHARRWPDRWFGEIDLSYRCAQPVHVGAGFRALAGSEVVRRCARDGSKLVIPGASMKGVVRSRFEAVTRSCAFDPPAEGRVRSQSRPDVTVGRLAPAMKTLDVYSGRCSERNLCPACALFGYQRGNSTLRSRVSVTDFAPADIRPPYIVKMPAQYEPRLHHLGAARVDEVKKEWIVERLDGRKFYSGVATNTKATVADEGVEALPVGTVVSGRIRMFNLEDAELGGLLVALGIEPASPLKVGGGKAHGFGRIAPTAATFAVRQGLGPIVDADVGAWSRALSASPDYWLTGAVRLAELHHDAC